MHTHFYLPIFKKLYRNRIVKVLCIFGVDRECRDMAEVSAVCDLVLCDAMRLDGRSFCIDCRRIVGVKALFKCEREHLGIIFQRLSEYLYNLSGRRLHGVGPVRDRTKDLVALLGARELVARNVDRSVHAAVIGHDAVRALYEVECARVADLGAAGDLDDLAVWVVVICIRQFSYLDFHTVPMKGTVQCFAGDFDCDTKVAHLHVPGAFGGDIDRAFKKRADREVFH